MLKILLACITYLLAISSSLCAEGVVGFWKTIDDKTGKPDSILGIYEYQGAYYGRLIVTYDKKGNIDATIYHPNQRATGVEGSPFYAGLDILWGLKPNGTKYTQGKIMDPQNGRIYDASMWTKDGMLYVRGEIWIFGANQIWPPAVESDFPPGFQKPDLTAFVPSIPQKKRR